MRSICARRSHLCRRFRGVRLPMLYDVLCEAQSPARDDGPPSSNGTSQQRYYKQKTCRRSRNASVAILILAFPQCRATRRPSPLCTNRELAAAFCVVAKRPWVAALSALISRSERVVGLGRLGPFGGVHWVRLRASVVRCFRGLLVALPQVLSFVVIFCVCPVWGTCSNQCGLHVGVVVGGWKGCFLGGSVRCSLFRVVLVGLSEVGLLESLLFVYARCHLTGLYAWISNLVLVEAGLFVVVLLLADLALAVRALLKSRTRLHGVGQV